MIIHRLMKINSKRQIRKVLRDLRRKIGIRKLRRMLFKDFQEIIEQILLEKQLE